MLPAYPRQSLAYGIREWSAVASGVLGTGDSVAEFEAALASRVGAEHGIAFPSGRAAIYFTLRALDPEPGDEVILPAYTFWIVPAVVIAAGFVPVAVDVEPSTFLLDPSKVEAAVGPRTRAIIVAHLNGAAAPTEELAHVARDRGLLLLEDCAQACGTEDNAGAVGRHGVGCFAFGVGKAVSTLGGGAATTRDPAIATRLRGFRDGLRDPGRLGPLGLALGAWAQQRLSSPWMFSLSAYPLLRATADSGAVERALDDDRTQLDERPMEGRFERMSRAQAAAGVVQLDRLGELNALRQRNAEILREALAGADGLALPAEGPGWIQLHFAVRTRRREAWVRAALRRGVDLQRDYCSAWPDLGIFRDRCRVVSADEARRIPAEVAYVPNHPSLGVRAMERIAARVRDAWAEVAGL